MTDQQTGHHRVLIAYATRGGSTRELAGEVVQVLEESGLSVDLRPVTDAIDVASYSAVVLGSALYFQRLMPDALRFLQQNARALAIRPFALFSVGAEMRKGTPEAHAAAESWVRRSLNSIQETQPFAVEHFAGAVELRRLGFWWRLLVLMTFGERGDWRDMEHIRNWCASILPELVPNTTNRLSTPEGASTDGPL